MVERLKEAAQKAGLNWQEGTATTEGGKVIPVAVIKHGNHAIFGVPQQGDAIELAYLIDFAEEDAQLLAAQSPEIKSRLMAVLRREMLEGRTGFSFVPDAKDKEVLRRIKIEQRWVADHASPAQVQRLVDAIQELVTVGVRCTDVLAHAFGSIKSNTGHDGVPDHVYI